MLSDFEPEIFPASEHFRNADRHATESMADLFGIGTNVVQAQQRHQSVKPRVLRIRILLARHVVRDNVSVSGANDAGAPPTPTARELWLKIQAVVCASGSPVGL